MALASVRSSGTQSIRSSGTQKHPLAGSSSSSSLVRMSLANHLSSSSARILSSGSSSSILSESGDVTILEGWLFVKQKDAWKRKYVSLHPNRVEWQNNAPNANGGTPSASLLQKRLALSSSSVAGFVALTADLIVARSEDDCAAFEIVGSSASGSQPLAKFSADSDGDVKRWVKELTKVIESLRGTAVPGGTERTKPDVVPASAAPVHTHKLQTASSEEEQKYEDPVHPDIDNGQENKNDVDDDSANEETEEASSLGVFRASGIDNARDRTSSVPSIEPLAQRTRALSVASRDWIAALQEAHLENAERDLEEEDERNETMVQPSRGNSRVSAASGSNLVTSEPSSSSTPAEAKEETATTSTITDSFKDTALQTAETELEMTIEEMNQAVLQELAALDAEAAAQHTLMVLKAEEARNFEEVIRIRKEEGLVNERVAALAKQEADAAKLVEGPNPATKSTSIMSAPSRALQALLLRDGVQIQAPSADAEQRSKMAVALSSTRKQLSAERDRAKRLESLRVDAESKRKALRTKVGDAQRAVKDTEKHVAAAGDKVQRTRNKLSEKEAALLALQKQGAISSSSS